MFPVDSRGNDLKKGDRYYNEGDYEASIAEYKGAIAAGACSPELYYNLGNAAFKADNFGLAVLSYERARKLDPRNKEINNNLQLVISKVDDANKADLNGKKLKVTPDDRSFFQTIHDIIASDHTSNSWATFAAISFVALIAMLATYIFASNIAARKVGFFGSLIFLFFSILYVIFAFMAASEYSSKDKAVIMAYKVSLLQDPDPDSKPSTTPLNSGTRVNILSTDDIDEGGEKWVKVKMNSDFIGWIKEKDIERI